MTHRDMTPAAQRANEIHGKPVPPFIKSWRCCVCNERLVFAVSFNNNAEHFGKPGNICPDCLRYALAIYEKTEQEEEI